MIERAWRLLDSSRRIKSLDGALSGTGVVDRISEAELDNSSTMNRELSFGAS
jgi:hypothetical protein